jgi:hypothetical protein
MANLVTVTLRAIDLISPAVDSIRQRLQGLGDLQGSLNDTGSSWQSFLGTFTGNLASSAALKGIEMLTSGVQKLKGTIQEAANLEVQDIASAGTLAGQLGIDFNSAQALRKRTSISTTQMAAELIGDNAHYRTISDQVAVPLAEIFKGNIPLFEKRLLEFTKLAGSSAAVVGAHGGNAGMAHSAFISGTRGMREVFQIDAFQKDPALQAAIRKRLAGRDLKKLRSDERLEILTESLRDTTNLDSLVAMEKTLSGKIEGIKTKVLDPLVGFFGVMREIDGRSVLNAANDSMGALIDLFGTINKMGSKSIKAMGISIDPMAGVKGVIDWFTDLTNVVHGAINGGSIGDISSMFSNAFVSIFEGLGVIISGTSTFLSAVDWGRVGEEVGYLTGELFTMIFTRVDWGNILAIVVKAFIGIGHFIVGFIWGAIKGNLTELGRGFTRLGDAIANWFSGIAKGLMDGFRGIIGLLPEPLKKSLGLNEPESIQDVTPINPPVASNQSTVQAFSPTVNVTGSNSPQETASAVVDQIAALWSQYNTAAIA